MGGGCAGLNRDAANPDYVFDTSVLSSFAMVGRLPLLERRYQHRAAWTIEVRQELMDGAAEVSALADAARADWLGEPIRMDDVLELVRIEKIRASLGGRPEDRRHLGEAATIVAAEAGADVVVTDDHDASRLARARGGLTINTVAILRACIQDSLLTGLEAKALLDEMIDSHARRLPRLALNQLISHA